MSDNQQAKTESTKHVECTQKKKQLEPATTTTTTIVSPQKNDDKGSKDERDLYNMAMEIAKMQAKAEGAAAAGRTEDAQVLDAQSKVKASEFGVKVSGSRGTIVARQENTKTASEPKQVVRKAGAGQSAQDEESTTTPIARLLVLQRHAAEARDLRRREHPETPFISFARPLTRKLRKAGRTKRAVKISTTLPQNLIDKSKVIIPDNNFVLVIDYPFLQPWKFGIVKHPGAKRSTLAGWTREDVFTAVQDIYLELYKKEDEAYITQHDGTPPPTIAFNCRNRATTEGPIGIWGHFFDQLYLEGAMYIDGHLYLDVDG